MAHHVDARYCSETNTYLPPLRQLGFNAQLKINDSLLAQSYIEAYDISYPEAIQRIETEVEEMKQMLQNNGYCELNDIGVLRLNEEGNIEFEPCEAGILTPELYGLNSVDIAYLNEQHSQNTAAKAEEKAQAAKGNAFDNIFGSGDSKPAPQLAVATAAKDENKAETEKSEDSKNEPRAITIKLSTLRNIGAACAAVLLFFLCSMPFGKMTQPEVTESSMDTGVLYQLLPKDKAASNDVRTITYKATPDAEEQKVTATEAETTQSEQKAEEQKAEEPTTTEKVVEAKGDHFYTIVLACRVARQNAEDYIVKLNKMGYDKGEVIQRFKETIIIYGRYATDTDARKALNSLKASDKRFDDGWIMAF